MKFEKLIILLMGFTSFFWIAGCSKYQQGSFKDFQKIKPKSIVFHLMSFENNNPLAGSVSGEIKDAKVIRKILNEITSGPSYIMRGPTMVLQYGGNKTWFYYHINRTKKEVYGDGWKSKLLFQELKKLGIIRDLENSDKKCPSLNLFKKGDSYE